MLVKGEKKHVECQYESQGDASKFMNAIGKKFKMGGANLDENDPLNDKMAVKTNPILKAIKGIMIAQ